MAIIPAPKRIESSHWYHPNGDACHEIEMKNGRMRNATLADARKMGLFPSVTGIIGVFAKPQLDTWKHQQIALASLRVEKTEKESEDDYANRVIAEAFQQVDDAAAFGTRLHKAIEDWILDGTKWDKDLDPYLDMVVKFFHESKIEIVETELRLVNKNYGYAGTMDMAFTYGQNGIGVLDFKTKKTKPNVEIRSFPFQDMQIAAYGATYWSEKLGVTEEEALARCLGANLFVSSTEPGRIQPIKYMPKQLLGCWPTFTRACEIWRYLKDYDPRGHAEAIGHVHNPDTSDIQKIFDEKKKEKPEPKSKTKEEPDKRDESLEGEVCKACGGSKKSSSGRSCRPCKGTGLLTAPKDSKDKGNPKEDKDDLIPDFVFPSGVNKGKSIEEVSESYLSKVMTSKQFASLREKNPGLSKTIELYLRGK